ncbi:hypothetical protein SAMN04490192_2891 [Pseudomonas lundensis]|uniref:hypothetical protein n=1 Tax=Pseudomonas lundensis TaxID=86185 RepID=UPI00088C6C35|nr:hypothetical protein [Pseudomonas lundensis]SDQ72121.1 hypothetical protein SAMN04490192_2891 [Pseudomonas lundensis]
MMQLNSARLAWHDALYTPWDSQGSHIEQIGLLGCTVQTTAKSVNSRHAMQQSISARIQHAIGTLPGYLQSFGNHMYSPMATVDEKEEAEERVLYAAYALGPKMTARKFEKARYVAQAVLLRYQRLHQGGQSQGLDPLPTAEHMRKWVLENFGVALVGDQWARDWGDFVERCFDACSQFDKDALVPVSRAIYVMKEAA